MGRDPGIDPDEARKAGQGLPGHQRARALFVLARVQAHSGDRGGALLTLGALEATEGLTVDTLLGPRVEAFRRELQAPAAELPLRRED